MTNLSKILADDFEFLNGLTEEIAEYGREDEDIEKVMNRHGLEPKDAARVLDIMESARYHANAHANRAADKGANAAIEALGGLEVNRDETGYTNPERGRLYDYLWHIIHEAVMPVEYKALANITE